jgi:hypothetical protein
MAMISRSSCLLLSAVGLLVAAVGAVLPGAADDGVGAVVVVGGETVVGASVVGGTVVSTVVVVRRTVVVGASVTGGASVVGGTVVVGASVVVVVGAVVLVVPRVLEVDESLGVAVVAVVVAESGCAPATPPSATVRKPAAKSATASRWLLLPITIRLATDLTCPHACWYPPSGRVVPQRRSRPTC